MPASIDVSIIKTRICEIVDMPTLTEEFVISLQSFLLTGDLEIIASADSIFESLEAHYPILGSQINWHQLPGWTNGNACHPAAQDRASRFFNTIVDQFNLSGDVFYCCDGSIDIALHSNIDWFRKNLPSVVSWPGHHYLSPPSAEWCFCFNFEGDIDFGFRLSTE